MQSHLFCFSDDAICVAEDLVVSFYAPKSLRKFRVEKFTDHRVAGIFIQVGAPSILHVIDCASNYVQVSLKTFSIIRSTTVRLEEDATSSSTSKPTISARRLPQAAKSASANVIQAKFYYAPESLPDGSTEEGELRAVLLCNASIFDFPTAHPEGVVKRYTFPAPLPSMMMDVGARTGLVVVAQQGQRWLHAVPFGQTAAKKSQDQFLLAIAVHSVACHPEANSVAVGGGRGELAVYPNVLDSHHFSDHWHHTPLQSLSYSTDGKALFTAASEGVMLVWNMHSFTHKKLGVNLGTTHAIVPNANNGAQLLLACADSTLATVDLLQHKVERSVEGVQWSTGKSCTGLVHTKWMGQDAVILTGLPNVIRVCDPLTHQAFYSLHIATQMETVPNPPEVGVRHVGVMDDGRVVVSYEDYGATALPSALRFWVYDAATKRHIETQTIYSPHHSAVLALCVDLRRRRVFTLSRNSVKVWAEAADDSNDATRDALKSMKRWKNVGAMATPSFGVSSMDLSEDGSVCMIADDCVYLYGVGGIRPGVAWPLLAELTQDVSTVPLRSLSLNSVTKTVSGQNSDGLFVWSLETGDVHVIKDAVTAACPYSDNSILCATADGSLKEVSLTAISSSVAGKSDPIGNIKATTKAGRTVNKIKYMRYLGNGRLAVVDDIEGYKTLSVRLDAPEAVPVAMEPRSAASRQQSSSTTLAQFFRAPARGAADSGVAAAMESIANAKEAKQWLQDVLGTAPYTAPPVSSILESYLSHLHRQK